MYAVYYLSMPEVSALLLNMQSLIDCKLIF